MKSIIKQLYTILLVTVACLTVTGCSDDFKSGLRLDGDVWVNSIRLDEYSCFMIDFIVFFVLRWLVTNRNSVYNFHYLR